MIFPFCLWLTFQGKAGIIVIVTFAGVFPAVQRVRAVLVAVSAFLFVRGCSIGAGAAGCFGRVPRFFCAYSRSVGVSDIVTAKPSALSSAMSGANMSTYTRLPSWRSRVNVYPHIIGGFMLSNVGIAETMRLYCSVIWGKRAAGLSSLIGVKALWLNLVRLKGSLHGLLLMVDYHSFFSSKLCYCLGFRRLNSAKMPRFCGCSAWFWSLSCSVWVVLSCCRIVPACSACAAFNAAVVSCKEE